MRLLGSHHSDDFMLEVYHLSAKILQVPRKCKGKRNPQMESLPNAGAKIYK